MFERQIASHLLEVINMSFEFHTTKSIAIGPDSSCEVGLHCKKLGILKAVVVSDASIYKLGLLDKMLQSLDGAAVEYVLFVDVEVDPPIQVVQQAIEFSRNNNIDGVIGVGGGSSMDTAKLIAALTYSKQSIQQVTGIDKLLQERLPLIQVPTTAGTGSEVTPISIVTTEDSTKIGILSTTLLPDIAILDPNLTLKLPASITAATGVDAMVHAIEAYTSVIKKNQYSDMLAREAVKLLAEHLPTAVHNGSDTHARSNVMLGATMAGQAFANAPVAAVHALAYPLGGHFHIPHGLSNALVLPHVLKFNLPNTFCLYAELADIAVGEESLKLKDSYQKAEALIIYVEHLVKDLGLPTRLSELGIKEQDLPLLAKEALQQKRLLVNNPRKLTELDILSIYQSAF